ncbi:LysR family transcriptional regulator [Archaeoglobus sp.]
MRIEFMKNFIKIVEAGSLKKASKEVGTSISTLSFQINQLEKFYGAKLLRRSSNGVVLTEEGKIAYENMKMIVESIVEAKRRIMELNGSKITIASGMVGINVVFNLQTLIKANYPNTKVEVVLRGAHDCLKGLLNGDYTFAIVGDVSKDRRFVYEVVGQDRIVLITSPNHPLAKKDTITIDEIKEYPLIILTDNYGITTSVIKALESSGLSLNEFKIGYTVDDYFTLLNLVSKNEGVAITSLIASYKACEMGLVVAKKVEDLRDVRKIYFVTTDVVMESKRYRDVADFIVRNAKILFESFDGCV